MEEKHILEVKNLSVTFPDVTGKVAAADNVSFYINQGETFALVGRIRMRKVDDSPQYYGADPFSRRGFPETESFSDLEWIYRN